MAASLIPKAGDLLDNNMNVLLIAKHGVGKCVAARDRITLTNGERVEAQNLVGTTFELPTMGNQGYEHAWAHAEWNAIEPVYELVSESGRRVTRNADHPFWAATCVSGAGVHTRVAPLGWTSMSELKPGMLVAIPERLPVEGTERMSEIELKVLAYLIGDGGYTTAATKFSQLDNAQLDEFRTCVERMNCSLVPAKGSDIDYRVVGPEGWIRPNRGKNLTRFNPVSDLLAAHELRFKHSRDKFLPDAIFTLPEDQLALFLSRLFSTDGWACIATTKNKTRAEIGFCSASERLVHDVQELMFRFGINGRVIFKGDRNAWVWHIHANQDVATFCREIGIYGKEAAVDQAQAHALTHLGDDNGRKRVWRWKDIPAGLRWERVRSVTDAGIEATVAIEVPATHTFLTSFWEHNTFSIMEECKKRGLRVKYYSCATLDPYTDLVGIPVTRKDENGVERLEMVRPRDIDEAEVVIFDEANRADPKVIDAIFEITQFGTINGDPLKHLKCCWAAINPPGDVYKVEDLDPAWLDRFDAFIEMDAKVSPKWMEENGLPKEIALALSTWWQDHDQSRRGDENYISPRRVMTIGQVYMAVNDSSMAIPAWITCERTKLRTLLERANKDMKARLDRDATDARQDIDQSLAKQHVAKKTATDPLTIAGPLPYATSTLGPNPSPAPTQQFGQGKTNQIQYDHQWMERFRTTTVRYLKENPEDFETHEAVIKELKNRHAPRLISAFAEILDALKPSILEGFLGSLDERRSQLLRDSLEKLPPTRKAAVPNLVEALN